MSNVGKSVVYVLTRDDADFINNKIEGMVNNHHEEGQELPAVIVRDWDAEHNLADTGSGCCNLQVFLDGHGSYWATSRKHGSDKGFWHG